MSYRPAFFCKSCNEQLSWNTKMHSHGVCPYCGASSGDTVVDCVTRAVWVEPPKSLWQRFKELFA